MISIVDKKDCVGCNACGQICPKACIDMRADVQGFLYPSVNLSECIDCHLCERVCPVLHQNSPRNPVAVIAAKNKDSEKKLNSSSGGVFFALGAKIIGEGGVVFGARFDHEWSVVHDYTEDLAGLSAFQGSKYSQSRICDSFKAAENFLRNGRKVMFTGTPCQLAALQLYLRRDYGDSLLKVEIVCHGVPSPESWRRYLDYVSGKHGCGSVSGISFRDKRQGWDCYGLSVDFKAKNGRKTEMYEPAETNLFMEAFLRDFNIRPSCSACPVKCGKSHSDITLGDFWGIRLVRPELYDDMGVSAVMSYTAEALAELKSNSSLEWHDADYGDVLRRNPSIENSATLPASYEAFWEAYRSGGWSACASFLARLRPSLFKRIIHRFKRQR